MLACASCGAQLEVKDGHELCPKCLGLGHLREALSDPCMNFGILPLSVRGGSLRQVEGLLFGDEHPPSGVTRGDSGSHKQREKHRGRPHGERSSPERKMAKEKAPSHQEIEALRAEIEQLRALVRAPPTRPQTAF